MNVDAPSPDLRQLGQEGLVQVRVLLEPIGDERLARQMWRDLSQDRREPISELRPAMDDVGEVRPEELVLQLLDREPEVPPQIGGPASGVGIDDDHLVDVDHQGSDAQRRRRG
jgi:hypothetical protein